MSTPTLTAVPDPEPDPARPVLADNITVTRGAGDLSFSLTIDGVPFRYAMAGDDGAQVVVSTEKLPAVTITLLARTVNVVDGCDLTVADLFEGGHAHD